MIEKSIFRLSSTKSKSMRVYSVDKNFNLFNRASIKIGHLEVEFPGGEVRTFGDPNDKKVRVTIKDSKTLKLVLNPDLALGESYMDNSIIIENDDLYGLLSLFTKTSLTSQIVVCHGLWPSKANYCFGFKKATCRRFRKKMWSITMICPQSFTNYF